MAWTRRQLIRQAYLEIGIGNDSDLQPDMEQDGRTRLDAMMANWNGRGVRVGYPLVNDPDSDLDTVVGVPDRAVEAIYTNLALRLAPMNGRPVSDMTKRTANDAFKLLLSRAADPPELQMPGNLPRGAGQRAWGNGYSPFVNPPTNSIVAGPDGVLDFDD